MIVDGYVRVSYVGGRSGDRFISPVVQREQIERWAKLHGAVVARVFEELDESGARPDRPLLEEAIRRVERGESRGLVVAYLTRFGRSLVHGLAAIDRITTAGGTFVSVQDGFDFSTDAGRLVLRFLLSVAEWELDRTRTGWLEATERAVARGVFVAQPPFGYRRGRDGRLKIEPTAAPIVVELFRQRAAGAQLRDLQRFLLGVGVPSPRGLDVWPVSSLAGLMRRRAYLGEVRWGSFFNAAAHPALLTTGQFAAAQTQHPARPRRIGHLPPLLTGVLRCAGCQRQMQSCSSGLAASGGTRRYACWYGPSRCTAPAIVTDNVIEPYIEALFFQELPKRRPDRTARRVLVLEAAVERKTEELEHYRDNPRLPATLGPERFAAGLDVRVHRLEVAQVELSNAEVAAGTRPASMKVLPEEWPEIAAHERREAISRLFECVFVSKGRGDIVPRTVVCIRGHTPSVVSSCDKNQGSPLDPATPTGPRLDRAAEWSEQRVKEELAIFLATWKRWPNFQEFQRAGFAQLHAQIVRRGGPVHWSRTIGFPYTLGGGWADDRIRRELRRFLQGRTVWPTRRDFTAAGLTVLRTAVHVTGGPERWAAEMGVDHPPQQRARTHWTYARMRDGVARLAQDRSDWPVHAEFAAAGECSLYRAVSRNRCRAAIAVDLGIRLPVGKKQIGGRWTEPVIKAALDEFLGGRDEWPTTTEFRKAGLGAVLSRFYRDGSRDRWARRYGFEL